MLEAYKSVGQAPPGEPLVVATGAGQIKTGAPALGERVAEYNRLIEIAAGQPDLPYGLA